MLLNLPSLGNTASLIQTPDPIGLPILDGVLPLSNLTANSASNSSSLSAYSSSLIIDAIKELYQEVSTRYKHTYLIGFRAKISDDMKWTSLRVIFTNTARAHNRAMIFAMGADWKWSNPVIQNRDYGIGNKYLFWPALSIGPADANTLLKQRFPRAEWTAAFLYYPKAFSNFPVQPYYIYTMKPRILWDNYLFVGILDFKVYGSSILPPSVIDPAGQSSLTES